MRQLHSAIQAAQNEGDTGAIDQLKSQIVKLSERHQQYYPTPSPYFQDTRTERKF
jgi:hypothetical protein